MEFFKKLLSVISLLFVFLICFVVFGGIASLVGFVQSADTAEFGKLKVKTDRGVGVVELTGNIISSDGFRKSFKKIEKHDKVKAIVVRIDSPGGAVGASEEIYRIIKNSSKPTTCSLGNIAASGGVYAAVACNTIFANLGTITGSIGVVMMMPNVSEITGEHGFKMNVVKSGALKDVGSPFRSFTETDKNFLQDVVNQSYEQFVSIVSDNRGIPVDEVKKFADGRIILGEKALELGLIDAIGGLEDAAIAALKLYNKEEDGEPELVYAKKKGSFYEIFEQLEESLPFKGFFQKQELRLLYM